jgi:hypothetical protein
MPTNRKSKLLAWCRDFSDKQRKLRGILDYLENVKKGDLITDAARLADEDFHKLGIELSDLDFVTGETSPSVVSYFAPSCDDTLRVSSSGVDPSEDRFWKYNRSNTKRVYGDHDWPEYLEEAFYEHIVGLRRFKEPRFRWRSIL